MSDAIALLPALRDRSVESLATLLAVRRVPSRGITGIIDLAEYLTSKPAIRSALSGLGWQALTDLARGEPAALERAATIALATSSEEGVSLLPSAQAELTDLLAPFPGCRLDTLTESAAHPEMPFAALSEQVFATVSLAADLLRALDTAPRAVRTTREGALLGGIELRRIAVDLDAPSGHLHSLAHWARDTGTMGVIDSTWHPAERGRTFIVSPAIEQWRDLTEWWLESLSLRALAYLLESHAEGSDNEAVLTRPESDFESGAAETGEIEQDGQTELEASIHTAMRMAERLGLRHRGEVTALGALALTGRLDEAAALLAPHLPQEVEGVYVQPDLTIIAPGPLRADLDAALRGFTDLDSRALASSYRISAASISRGLSTGLQPSDILRTLGEVSLNGIPQPVEYLVNETGERHGTIRVRAVTESGAITRITSTEPKLLDALEVDQSVSALGLTRVSEWAMTSRISSESVFWTLSEAKYPVAAENEAGDVVSLRRVMTAESGVTRVISSATQRLAERLHEDARSLADNDEFTILRHQLDTARRAKAEVVIRVEVPGSDPVELTVVPTSVSPQRIRVRDTAADVERTLPISIITAVLPAQ